MSPIRRGPHAPRSHDFKPDYALRRTNVYQKDICRKSWSEEIFVYITAHFDSTGLSR
jgi:hypothetical protein